MSKANLATGDACCEANAGAEVLLKDMTTCVDDPIQLGPLAPRESQ
jgi:hypothetical protein